jgi:putative SOS response-associated peptidase YedK
MPSFRNPLQFRRCLIPADGFYEWRRSGTTKQPFCFEVSEGELFAFAGLWDRWKDPGGQWVESCSILTTTPNAVTSTVHYRMPVIVRRDDYNLWLDPGMTKVDAVTDVLRPFDAHLMRAYPVSSRVNQVQKDDSECSAPVELEPSQQGQLFG